MAATTNVPGRSEYVRLCNALAGAKPADGGDRYEIRLTPVEVEQIGLAIETARGLGDTPSEYRGWLTDVQSLWGATAGAGAGVGAG